MSEFIADSNLNAAIDEIISTADSFLMLISPYIKFHERVIYQLKRRKPDDNLQIELLFGKQEGEKTQNINKEDIEFLKDFPNISIYHEKNLHAKYYASDNLALVTSMNLYQFSQNTNIEVGIKIPSKSELYEKSLDYFDNLIDGSDLLFKRTPEYETSGFLGRKKNYLYSKTETDILNEFFNGKAVAKPQLNIRRENYNNGIKPPPPKLGYCIRTGVKIPFNLEKPFCNEAYQSWAQFKNPDYKEKYDHLTGEPSNGKTSMRKPIL